VDDRLPIGSASRAVVMSVLFMSGAVLAQSLPGAITPGGVLPRKEITTPEPKKPAPEQELLPQKDKPPVSDDGAKIEVVEIRFEDVVERLAQGVILSDIQAIADQALTEHDTWSLSQLQQITGRITDYYRSKGFLLSRAYLPAQDVAAGVIIIRIIEGKLGQLQVDGNQVIRNSVYQKISRPLNGQVLENARLESTLLYLSDLPGQTGKAVLRKGEQPGTADLLYTVQTEDRVDAYINLDNYGSEFVGENRARVDIVWKNPTRSGDQFTFSALSAFNPSNNDYLGFDYRIPYINKKGKPVFLGFSGSRNKFNVGGVLEPLDISGESDRLDLFMRYPLARGRLVNSDYGLALASKQSTTEQKSILTSEDKLTVIVGDLGGSRQNTALFGGIGNARLSWSQGLGDFLGSMAAEDAPRASRLGSSGKHAGADFGKLNLYSSLFQRLSNRWSTQVRLEGQWSDDLLVSLEQFPMGGPYSVRAYPLSAYLMDKGVFASVDFSFSFNRYFQASVFLDYASGTLNQPLESDIQRADMSGAGVGVRVAVSDRFSIVATAAQPIGSIAPGFDQSKDDWRYFVGLSGKLF